MSEILPVLLVVFLSSLFSFFILRGAIKNFGDFEFKQIALLSIVMPVSAYLPVFFFNILELKAFLLYLITIPSGAYLTKKIINVKTLTFKQIGSLYFQLLWKVIVGFTLLGAIARLTTIALK